MRGAAYRSREITVERQLFKGLKPILYGGREVWPLVEGGNAGSAN